MIDETRPVLTGKTFESIHKLGSIILVLQRQIVNVVKYGLVENWTHDSNSEQLRFDPSVLWTVPKDSYIQIAPMFTEKTGIGSLEITMYENAQNERTLVSHQQYLLLVSDLDTGSDTYIDFIQRRKKDSLSSLKHDQVEQVLDRLVRLSWNLIV